MGQTSYTNIPGGVTKAPFGGVTIYIKGHPYRLTNYGPTRGSRSIRRNDSNGDQEHVMHRREPKTQSGITAQLASKNTPPPPLFSEFPCPLDPESTVMVITAVTEARQEGEFWVCNFDAASNT